MLSHEALVILCQGAKREGFEAAERYSQRRTFHAGSSSTLRKAQRVRRIALGLRPERFKRRRRR